ncbi:MAG: GNAT family N-acetyltransferase, partial [Vulcanimicrobiaceae bacterium]
EHDSDAAIAVLNEAAEWYREFLAAEHQREQEMTADEFDDEAERMTWYGAFHDGLLAGVAGLEPAGEAVLFRHAYVLPSKQHTGVGTLLLEHMERSAAGSYIIVGTYEKNVKARRMLEKHGYRLTADSESLLRQYYKIPEDRLVTSVVYEKKL